MISPVRIAATGAVLFLLACATPAHAGETELRVAFGDRGFFPTNLLKSCDLVWKSAALGLGTNEPQMRLCKFTDTSKMTPAELARRKAAGYNWICYDNEDGKTWPTPKAELIDPTKYTIRAAQLAHAAGFKFLAEPNFDLLTGHGSRGMNGKLELTDKPVSAVRLAEAGLYLDAISLQLQRAQADVEQYRKLTRQYTAQMRAANSNAVVFVQVTSRAKSGKKSTAAELMPSIQSVADDVDGVWIHVDNGDEAFATEVVTLMAQARYR